MRLPVRVPDQSFSLDLPQWVSFQVFLGCTNQLLQFLFVEARWHICADLHLISFIRLPFFTESVPSIQLREKPLIDVILLSYLMILHLMYLMITALSQRISFSKSHE